MQLAFYVSDVYGVNTVKYSTLDDENMHVSVTFNNAALMAENGYVSIEMRVMQKSLTIGNIQAEFASEEHAYEEIYDAGQVILTGPQTSQLIPKLGYNQVVQIDGDTNLITVSIETRPLLSGVRSVSWSSDAASALRLVTSNGQYYHCGKNIFHTVSAKTFADVSTNSYGTEISESDGVFTVAQSQATDSSNLRASANGLAVIQANRSLNLGCDLTFSFTVEVTGSLLETDGSFWCVSPTAKYYNVTPDASGRVSVTIPYSELYYDKDKRNFMELRLAGRSVVLSNLQVECGSSETEYVAPTANVETLTVENNQPEFAQYVGSNCIVANRDNAAFELIELYGVL